MIATVGLISTLLTVGIPQSSFDEFQQGVDYRIEATLDEDREVLRGRARLRYENRSSSVIDTLFFHQHLNAFRPNSAWARRELEFGERRFTDLSDEEHAFEHFVSVNVDGEVVQPLYPGAPDSTVAAIPLPAALDPGETVEVLMDWEARLSTLPRRQGRRGRAYDFAQWYPRIAVFDEQGWRVQPLMPQGEFYGEFATFDVTLDLVGDQVLGATGVPISGDPGWEGALMEGAEIAPARRGLYLGRPEERLGLHDSEPIEGRKQVRWFAEDVHHFAWSTNPQYRYEGGTHDDVSVHVLFQPGDEETWGGGVVVERTIRSLAWLETVFGPYPYPQVTNVHRIEGGGTEFPMLVMDGSASQNLITHEVGHIYLHGILANNEWQDAWLDEGFVSFVTNWFNEELNDAEDLWSGALDRVASFEATQTRQPVATASADFVDFQTYNTLSYTKGSIFFYMLRELMGPDDFRRALQHYFMHNKFTHVRETDFQRSVEAVYGRDLGWFFFQWLHTTDWLDYGVEAARTERAEDGSWNTEVTISLAGAAWMPVVLQVGDVQVTLSSRASEQVVRVRTLERPSEVILDPHGRLLDRSRENNRRPIS